MTDFYSEDFIKRVKGFNGVLNDNWYKALDKMPDREAISEMKFHVHYMQCAVKVLYLVIESEMRETNRLHNIISKLPDGEKYQELKKIVEERDDDIGDTLKPISKYVKELEDSKKRRPNYIE